MPPKQYQYNPMTCSQVITDLVKFIQGNTVIQPHSDEPYMQKYGKLMEKTWSRKLQEHDESKMRLVKTRPYVVAFGTVKENG